MDECSLAEPVCTKDHEKCTNREGGYTCVCDIGYEREGEECKVRPKGEYQHGLSPLHFVAHGQC